VQGAAVSDFDEDPFSRKSIERLVAQYGSPLLIVDAERVRHQYRRLRAALPGVDLHYALKPLPHATVVRVLDAEGAFFDLATSGEVELVRTSGVAPQRCVHTHPVKRDSDIRTALGFGVRTFVADNPDEIRKFSRYRNRVSLLIRVAFRSPDATCDLSRKFGCEPDAVAGLLRLAGEERIDVEGLSFHVGSQTATPGMYVEAIRTCRELLQQAMQSGRALRTLDIGGGFPADYVADSIPIEEFCAPIRTALAALPPGLRLIAEPGRYIVAPAAIAVATIMGRALRNEQWWYYLDDGLYGSYSGQLFDHATFPLEALGGAAQRFPSVLAGPTCDSIDVIAENIALPHLGIGDLIVGRSMGAYTWATATDFNLFPKAMVLTLDRGRLMTEVD
jgi:ornithine decarboxylase